VRCYWKPSVTGPLTFESYFRFLEDELPVLLDVPLHIRRELYLQQDDAPRPQFWQAHNCISSIEIFKTVRWIGGSSFLATEVTCPNSFGVLSLGKYEVSGVSYEVERYG